MMRNLIAFASANRTVSEAAVRKVAGKFDDIYLLVTEPSKNEYNDFGVKNVKIISVSSERFNLLSVEKIKEIYSKKFDSALIISGTFGFIRFYNILEIISELSVNSILMINIVGKIQRFSVRQGLRKKIDAIIISICIRWFFMVSKIELLCERIVCKCVGLLGL